MKNDILTILLLLAIVSCDSKKNEINPEVDSYPMTIGTEWTYDRQIIIKKYESDTSDNIIDTEIYNFTVNVWIDKDTLLKDTMNVIILEAQDDDNDWTQKSYRFIDNEGLKTYAYSPRGAIVFAKKKGTLKSSFLLNNNFLLVNEISPHDEIIYEEQPTLDIKLPLKNNSSWIYRHSNRQEIPNIEKEVIGTERLNLAGEIFDCFKVYWYNLNLTETDGIEITDWISDKGLIKRIIFSDRIFLRNEFGEYFGTAQLTETLILKELEIQ